MMFFVFCSKYILTSQVEIFDFIDFKSYAEVQKYFAAPYSEVFGDVVQFHNFCHGRSSQFLFSVEWGNDHQPQIGRTKRQLL